MDPIKQRILDTLTARRGEIISFGNDIFRHAELGFCEWETAEKFAKQLEALGLRCETGLARTGVKSFLFDTKRPGPTVCVMGELDALPIPNSQFVNEKTGAAHACGHNAQLAAVLGSAMALTDPAVAETLCGNVVFIGVPCEESIPSDKRDELIGSGEIVYEGGKCELIRIGALDGIDITLAHHNAECGLGIANESTSGTLTKSVRYIGRAVHAAAAPEKGLDAASAAAIGQHALALQREGFRFDDHVSIHGFLSRGGSAANILADDVRLEYLIRAATTEGLADAARRFDRAFRAGAVATGCGLEIRTTPGYLPERPFLDLDALDDAIEATRGGAPRAENDRQPRYASYFCSDLGDVCSLMPVLRFNTGGFSGNYHGTDLHVSDEELAYVQPAKIFALTVYNLLKDGAAEAKKVIAGYRAPFTKQQYLSYKNSLNGVLRMEAEG